MRHVSISEVPSAGGLQAIHHHETGFHGVAATEVKAAAGINEQHRALRIGENDFRTFVHMLIKISILDAITIAPSTVAKFLGNAVRGGRR